MTYLTDIGILIFGPTSARSQGGIEQVEQICKRLGPNQSFDLSRLGQTGVAPQFIESHGRSSSYLQTFKSPRY